MTPSRLQLGALPVRERAPSGDVLGISVVPAPGRAEVVIDVRGSVEVTDFVLQNPARLVLDLTGVYMLVLMAACGWFFADPPRNWWPASVDPLHWAQDEKAKRNLARNPPAQRIMDERRPMT